MKAKRFILTVLIVPVFLLYAGATSVTAKPSTHQVYVNGVKADIAAYNIDGNNYYKLRDVAAILNNTKSQFNVKWNEVGKRIDLISNQSYNFVGEELSAIPEGTRSAISSTATVYKDGSAVHYVGYLIAGNNYYMLRDIATSFSCKIAWDGLNRRIDISTEKDTVPESQEPEIPAETVKPIEPTPPVEEPEPEYQKPVVPDETIKPVEPTPPVVNPEPEPEMSKWEEYQNYKAIIDRKIDEIKNEGRVYYGSDSMYQNEVNQLLAEISSLQSRANILERDDSRQAQAELITVLEKLEKAQAELADLQAARARQTKIQSLEDMLDQYYNNLFH